MERTFRKKQNRLIIKAKGIYLWGFTIDNDFIPYYVGKAEDIQYRLCKHLNCIVGGKYTIYHKDCLKEFAKYGDKPIEQGKGKLYHPDWPKSFPEFLNMRKQLQPHIDFMVDTFTFTYAEAMDYLIELEKLCISEIGIERLANSRVGIVNDITINHSGCNTIIDLFKIKPYDYIRNLQ